MRAVMGFPDPSIIGQYRTFGEYGPTYRVLRASEMRNGEWFVRILVVESGEETDYPYAKAAQDPSPN